jgi:hypothetical protein
MSRSKTPARRQRAVLRAAVGVGLGLFASLAWSGWLVVSGRYAPVHTAAEVRAWMAPAPAAHRLSVEADAGIVPPCHLAPVVTPAGEEAL